jgi:hypothetical protein
VALPAAAGFVAFNSVLSGHASLRCAKLGAAT